MTSDETPDPLPRSPATADLTTEDNGVTFMIVCAAGPVVRTLHRLRVELDSGRRVNVVATPQAAVWLDHADAGRRIEAMTGWPIRSELAMPTEATFEPQGSSILVSPCTLNTLTKWAAAHSDNLAISLLCEALGRGVPTRAEVSLSGPYASLPAARAALQQLSELGVELCRAPGAVEPSFLPAAPADVVGALAVLAALDRRRSEPPSAEDTNMR